MTPYRRSTFKLNPFARPLWLQAIEEITVFVFFWLWIVVRIWIICLIGFAVFTTLFPVLQ